MDGRNGHAPIDVDVGSLMSIRRLVDVVSSAR